MKSILTFTACVLMLCAASLSAHAKSANEAFLLPEGRIGEAYQVDIETLLRQRYRLKIDTGTRESILQWFVVDGELPPGLTIRTDGKVVGTPETYRARPYVFSVKVVDQALANADPLIISVSIAIAAPRLRLTRIEGPALVPLDNAASSPRENGPQASDVSTTPEPQRLSGVVMDPGPEVKSPPLAAQAVASSSEDRRILPKILGVVGLQDRNGPTNPKGCEDGSNARRAVSDEAHNPLEGDTSTQGTCVEFRNLNTLKYRFEFNTKTTRTEGPDLSTLPFLAKVTTTTTSATPKANTPAPGANAPGVIALSTRTVGVTEAVRVNNARKMIEDQLKILDRNFNSVAEQLTTTEVTLRNHEESINTSVTDVQNAHNRSVRLANAADLYLQSNNTTPLLTEVKETREDVVAALERTWPSAELTSVTNTLTGLNRRLENLRFENTGGEDISQEAWTEWLRLNQDRYSRVRDRIAELKTKVNTVNEGATAFNQAKNVLSGWQLVIENAHNQKQAAFTQKAFVGCHTDEGESKSSKLTIIKTDRTTTNATAVTRDVLTVHCYSRVAFTAGFNFSTLDEKEFSVVQSAGPESGSTVKKFGFTNRSSFRPNPLAMLNIRFTNQPNINWHASFGAVVDLKGQTGTDVEPVAGVSFSIRRLIFITPFAVHFGRVNKLAGGFNEGDLVPDSIATPPIEKSWKAGYTGGITFRIAPQ